MKHVFCLAALLALSACGKGQEGARPVDDSGVMLPDVVPLPECPDADYAPCDFRDAACQARLIELACCLRQSEPIADLSVEVMSVDQFSELLSQDYAEYPEPPTHYDRAASVLGLALAEGVSKEQAIESRVDFLDGVYRAKEKRIIVIDHDVPNDGVNENALFVHEYVHALQDADYDLLNWPQSEPIATFDQYLASRAVLEGEATFYQYRAAVPLLGLDIARVDFRGALEERLREDIGRAFYADTPLGASYTTFPYGWGAPLAFEAWLNGGPRGVDPLWASPPSTTQQILSQLSRIDTPQPSGSSIPEPVIETLTLDSQDSWGAWGLELFYFKHDVTTGFAEHALAWRGDHVWVYTDADGEQSFGLWQLELASAEEAQTLDGIFAAISGVEHGAEGSRVFASFGFEGASPELSAWGRAWLAPP